MPSMTGSGWNRTRPDRRRSSLAYLCFPIASGPTAKLIYDSAPLVSAPSTEYSSETTRREDKLA